MSEVIAVLAVFGLACLAWLAWGWLILPGPCPLEITVVAAGNGAGLEHTLRALRWLRRSGVFTARLRLRDGGLDREGLQLALRLAREYEVAFCGREP